MFFVMLLLPIFINSICYTSLEFEIKQIENDNRKYIEVIEEENLTNHILNYSVSQDGNIAVSMVQNYINIYDSNGVFKYCYKLHLSGSEIYVEYVDNDIYLYDYRMKNIYLINNGEIEKTFIILQDNEKKQADLQKYTTIVGDSEYNMNASRTILRKLSSNENIEIINIHQNYVIDLVLIISGVVTSIIMVLIFSKKKHQICTIIDKSDEI